MGATRSIEQAAARTAAYADDSGHPPIPPSVGLPVPRCPNGQLCIGCWAKSAAVPRLCCFVGSAPAPCAAAPSTRTSPSRGVPGCDQEGPAIHEDIRRRRRIAHEAARILGPRMQMFQ